MGRATSSPSSAQGEQGFTLVEIMVTLMILGIIATAVLGVAMRAFKDTSIISSRRDVLGDGQIALQRMTKDLRQASSIDEATSTATRVDFTTYIDGVEHDVSWVVQGSSAPYRLVRSVDGGTAVPMFQNLASSSVFTYEYYDGLLNRVDILMDLETQSSDVPIEAQVFLRNVA